MKKQYKNQQGFSHHFILPLLAFVAVGAIGAYVISKSNAATAGPSDVVYSTEILAGGQKNYRYVAATSSSSEYPDTDTILDVSKDQKWLLLQKWQRDGDNAGQYAIVATSTSGENVTYGYMVGDASCNDSGFSVEKPRFSKQSSTSAPVIYYVGVSLPCSDGSYDTNKATLKLYSMGVDGANKKELSKAIANDGSDAIVSETATNGYVHFYAKGRHYIVTSAGKTIFNVSYNTYSNVILSENGKKIAYEKYSSGDKMYLANSDGKKAKKLMSYSDLRILTGISPSGSYILYQKDLSKDGTKTGLYSYNTSTKKTKMLDSGYGAKDTYPGAIDQEQWLPGSNTLVYTKRDVKAKTSQLIRVGASGTSKKTLVTLDYNTVGNLTIY